MKDPEENNTDPWAQELFNHLCAINSPMPQVIVRVAIRNPANGYSVAIARAHPALARKNDLEAMSKTCLDALEEAASHHPQNGNMSVALTNLNPQTVLNNFFLAAIPTAAAGLLLQHLANVQPLDNPWITPALAGLTAGLVWTTAQVKQRHREAKEAIVEITYRVIIFRSRSRGPSTSETLKSDQPGRPAMFLQAEPLNSDRDNRGGKK